MTLKITNLCFSYESPVLHDISFELNEGEFVCLCGPNGSGKSTLLNCLAGLVDCNAVEKMPSEARAKKIAFMIQNESCVWNFTVRDFIALGRFAYGDENSDHARSLIENTIEALNLRGIAGKGVNRISGGEFQKARIARTIVQETPVLLLDEPVANLDFEYQFGLLGFLKNYCHAEKKTVLVSIHDINLASIFADRIMLLGRYGKNAESGKNARNEKKSGDETAGQQGGQYFVDGTVNEGITEETLRQAFNMEFGIFEHPEYKARQVFVKEKNER